MARFGIDCLVRLSAEHGLKHPRSGATIQILSVEDHRIFVAGMMIPDTGESDARVRGAATEGGPSAKTRFREAPRYPRRTEYGMRFRLAPDIVNACISAGILMTPLVMGVPATVHADENPSNEELREIVVTAEKRESTVQSTPLSITAVSAEDLLERGVSRLEELAIETPGISMKTFSPGETEYEMRGLSSSGGSSATVGFYLDDVPMAAAANSFQGTKALIDPDLYDLQRIEVLRGPQGTLYGSGSMGGTIRIITAPPMFNSFQSSSQTDLGGTEHGSFNWGESAMVNLPVVDDELAVRLVGTYKYDSGWVTRVTVSPFPIGPGGDCGWNTCTRGDVRDAPVVASVPQTNWVRTEQGRAEVRYQPVDRLTVDVLLMHQEMNEGAFPQVDQSVGIDNLEHYTAYNYGSPLVDTFGIGSLVVNYDLDFGKLTSASAMWNHDTHWVAEASEPQEYLWATFYGFKPFVSTNYPNSDTTTQTSEELRLASQGSGSLRWLVGGFFSTLKSIAEQGTSNPVYAPFSVGGVAANPTGIAFYSRDPFYIKQYAAFTEESYQITNSVKATVGIRYYRYSSELDSAQSGIFAPSGNATLEYSQASTKDSGTNPKVNLSYEPSKDLTLYGQIAKGFRPGGLNYPAPVAICPIDRSSYRPDYIWNYELGEKARFDDGRVQLNTDVYYIRWYNVQQTLTLPCSYEFTTNVGNGESYGPELELFTQLTRALSFSVSGTYTQAHIVSVNPSLSGSTVGATEALVPGIPLLNVPRYSFTEMLKYTLPVTDTFNLIGMLSATTTGPVYDINYYVERLSGYTTADARIGAIGGPWQGYLYVRNLTDKIAETSIANLSYDIPNPALTMATVTTPRTIGVQLNYSF